MYNYNKYFLTFTLSETLTDRLTVNSNSYQEKLQQHCYQQYDYCNNKYHSLVNQTYQQLLVLRSYLISKVDSILREVGCSIGKGCLFYQLMKQVTCDSFGQHTSLPYFNLQVSFRGNVPLVQPNEGPLSATLVGE